jgi:hypothetical protein
MTAEFQSPSCRTLVDNGYTNILIACASRDNLPISYYIQVPKYSTIRLPNQRLQAKKNVQECSAKPGGCPPDCPMRLFLQESERELTRRLREENGIEGTGLTSFFQKACEVLGL